MDIPTVTPPPLTRRPLGDRLTAQNSRARIVPARTGPWVWYGLHSGTAAGVLLMYEQKMSVDLKGGSDVLFRHQSSKSTSAKLRQNL